MACALSAGAAKRRFAALGVAALGVTALGVTALAGLRPWRLSPWGVRPWRVTAVNRRLAPGGCRRSQSTIFRPGSLAAGTVRRPAAGSLAHPIDHLPRLRPREGNRPPGCGGVSRIQSTICRALFDWSVDSVSHSRRIVQCFCLAHWHWNIVHRMSAQRSIGETVVDGMVDCERTPPAVRRKPGRRPGKYARYVYPGLTPPAIPLHLEYRGRSGFDVFGEVEAACRGGRYLVNQRQQSQLPTINWHWLRK